MNQTGPHISYGISPENIENRLFREIVNKSIVRTAEEFLEENANYRDFQNLKHLEWIFIDVSFNLKCNSNEEILVDYNISKKWKEKKIEGANSYVAYICMDLTPWSRVKTNHNKKLDMDQLLEHFKKVGSMVFAQIALKYQEEEDKVDRLLAKVDLSVRNLESNLRQEVFRNGEDHSRFSTNLEIEVFHGNYNQIGNLELRQKIGEALEIAMRANNNGIFQGSEGSEEHFEFAYLVKDSLEARTLVLEALSEIGFGGEQVTLVCDGIPMIRTKR